jgi:hypothetical protein
MQTLADLINDPRVDALAELAGVDAHAALGAVLSLWARSQAAGVASLPDTTALEQYVGGDNAASLILAMQKTGFIQCGVGGQWVIDGNADVLARKQRYVERARKAAMAQRATKSSKKSSAKPARAMSPKPKNEPPTAATWEAYKEAFFAKHSTWPADGRKVRGQIKQLIERVGAADAPHLARYYLTREDARYTHKSHDFGLLLMDSHALHTQWKTNQPVTFTQARKQEQSSQQNDKSEYELAMQELHQHDDLHKRAAAEFYSSGRPLNPNNRDGPP